MDDHKTSVPFTFDSRIIENALKNIQSRQLNTKTQIDQGLFSEVNRILSSGIDIACGDDDRIDGGFKQDLQTNTEVFAAFKAHRMGRDMASQLLDADGNVKPFRQFKKDTEGIVSHHVNAWLRTEYDTAIRRAHRAAEMRQFIAEADVFPNIEWLPSTAVNPREAHMPFYHHIWPINDPFWDEHKPGDEWGCQCGWKSTDKPATDNKGLGGGGVAEPSPGLGGNPAKTGQVFSDDHPYFPSDCAHCGIYNASIKNRLASVFYDRKKDCYNCPYIRGCIRSLGGKAKYTLEERKKIYASPVNDQFTPVFKRGKAMVSKHLIKSTESEDYQRVLDVAKAFAKGRKKTIFILPEINANEKDLRRTLGLSTDNGNTPDIMLELGSFVDVKSPLVLDKLSKNAGKAFKQSAVACITDHRLDLDPGKIDNYAKSIFKNATYENDTVYFYIKGRLYKKTRE